jgi:hypothetical protein
MRGFDTLFSYNKCGERREPPRVYRHLLFTTHIIVSGGWPGIALAKLVLTRPM